MSVPIHEKMLDNIVQQDAKLRRGQVWCLKCGRSERVDSAQCLAHGWPKCCGETMTIDSPEERAARAGGSQ